MDTLSKNRPVAVVLGGTSPHAELCLQLRQRGYSTILVDYLESPPAKKYADIHIRESTLDADTVLRISVENNAELVIAACIDQANVTACDVLQKMGKFSPYSLKTALAFASKSLMKTILVKHSIPTSSSVTVSSSESRIWESLRFPLIVKPCDSNSSKGVRRCNSHQEVVDNLRYALQYSRQKEAIVEEYIEGREIALDAYVLDGEVHVLITRERRKISNGICSEQQIFGSYWPAKLTGDEEMALKKIVKEIAVAFQLKNTFLVVQTILSKQGFSVIECAPRVGGGDNFNIIKMATGFDVVSASIDSFMGIQPRIHYKKPEFVTADNYLYAKPGRFGNVTGLDALYNRNIISSYKVYKRPGDIIGREFSSNNRVAVFTMAAYSQSAIDQNILGTISQIEIFDDNGNSSMNREIYRMPRG